MVTVVLCESFNGAKAQTTTTIYNTPIEETAKSSQKSGT